MKYFIIAFLLSVFAFNFAMADSITSAVEQKAGEIADNTASYLKAEIASRQREWVQNFYAYLKRTVKETFKNWINNRIENVKSMLNPPKRWVRQGSDKIRGWYYKLMKIDRKEE